MLRNYKLNDCAFLSNVKWLARDSSRFLSAVTLFLHALQRNLENGITSTCCEFITKSFCYYKNQFTYYKNYLKIILIPIIVRILQKTHEYTQNYARTVLKQTKLPKYHRLSETAANRLIFHQLMTQRLRISNISSAAYHI